jgi:hypothetical protein
MDTAEYHQQIDKVSLQQQQQPQPQPQQPKQRPQQLQLQQQPSELNATVRMDDDDSSVGSHRYSSSYLSKHHPHQQHPQQQMPCSKRFLLLLASNFCFVVASAFYIALGVVGLRFLNRTANYPDYVLEADDDATWHEYTANRGHSDDVVFTIGQDKNGATDDAWYDDSGVYYVTLYELFYFCGALGFVFTGILDCINEPDDKLGSILILAGIFGLASAGMSERDAWISEILNATSVHLFLFEAVGMFLYRHSSAKYKRRHPDALLQRALMTGKACFLTGSLIDVVLSYIALVGQNAGSTTHAKIEIFSATLWYICSLIFILHTVAEESQLRHHTGNVASPVVSSSSSSSSQLLIVEPEKSSAAMPPLRTNKLLAKQHE